ncbi:MAG: protein phosphatase [Acidimicrobiales bacterium]|nr:protein phosphatase [Acidimicrobiales bacterium]
MSAVGAVELEVGRGGFAAAVRELPADLSGVSGDWSDLLTLPDGAMAVVVGDAAGHGPQARPVKDALRPALRRLARSGAAPADLLANLRPVLELLDGIFATVVCTAVTSDGRIVVANAGHPPPLVLRADGSVRFLTENLQPPLGAPYERAEPVVQTVCLQPGDTLVLYTDGVVDHHDNQLDRGLARLAATALRSRHAPLDHLCRRLVALGDPADDRTVLAVRRRPASQPNP